MKPTGTLPDLLSHVVSVQVTQQVAVFDEKGKLETEESKTIEIPLYEAVREARYSLLLGELGSGKSTLAASLVLTTMERAKKAVAFIIPAKDLASISPSSPASILSAIDQFISEHVSLSKENPPIAKLLQENIEVLFVLDGLDEVEKKLAAQFLRYLALLAKVNSTLQVVATARPVELTGVSFDDWKIVRTLALKDQQRLAVFKNEMIADGTSPEEAMHQAAELLDSLKALPALDAVANTPLFLRLLYPKLSNISKGKVSNELTLGDLLFEVVVERLDRWGLRDEKNSVSAFQTFFASPESKAILFGELAKQSLKSEQFREADAKGILISNLSTRITEQADKFKLASEALENLQNSGFITSGEKMEFTSQPLKEMLAAITFANDWATVQGELKLPNIEEWRVVGFAASVARRWQLQEKIRPMLISYCQTLLNSSPMYLTAVATISSEFQDVRSAQVNLDVWQTVLPGQFAFNFNGNERSNEARVIAQMIFLAEQKGFEWFYANYFDPREPASRMGSALVEEVFRHYVTLLLNNTRHIDVMSLKNLIAPHQACRNSLTLELLPYLVLLLPESFPDDERVKLLCSHIGNSKFFNKQAADVLRQIAATGECELVRSSLLERVQEYGQINLYAAALWLELSKVTSKELPEEVTMAAFVAFGNSSTNIQLREISKFASDVKVLLGEEAWQQHARWALSNSRTEIATSAAIALFESGQQNFWLLNDALLQGVNDYFQNSRAEEILEQLVKKKDENSYTWLINQSTKPFKDNSDWSKGLGVGCWRLLLPIIESLADGPRLLGSLLANLSIYTLSRHPEIREQFSQILSGDRGEEFQEALQDMLAHHDPKIRWGAAAVLIVFDPQQQADALIVAIQAQEGMDDKGVDNWAKFCLSLSFGKAPLQKLKEFLPEFTPKGRTYALAVLFVRRERITPAERSELFHSLLHLDYWQLNHYPEKPILSSPDAKPVLLNTLVEGKTRDSEWAASHLLAHHSDSLTPEQNATCIVRQIRKGSLKFELVKIVERLRSDRSYTIAVEEACTRLEANSSKYSFLILIVNALKDAKQWEAVVWEFVHRKDDFYTVEDEDIKLLYDIGQKYPEYRQFIGEAALKFSSEHDRWQNNELPKAVQWLVLLADEFLGGLPSEQLIRALKLSFTHGWYDKTYSSAASRALLARLPEIPEILYEEPRACSAPEVDSTSVDNQQELYERLIDFSREASSLPSEILNFVYKALFYTPYTEEQLRQLNVLGTPGSLISLTLRFCYGQPAKLEESVAFFHDFLSSSMSDNDKEVKKRLRKCWLLARNKFIHEKNFSPAKKEYIDALDYAFSQGDIWQLHIAMELLNVRGSLTPDQFRTIINSFSDSRSQIHAIIFPLLCEWLALENPVEVRSHLVPVLRDGLNRLNQLPWEQSTKEICTEAYFLFAFAYWAFAEEPIPATQNVYLRGIKQLFGRVGKKDIADFAHLLEAVEPLLQKVPIHYLTQAMEFGKHSHDPAIRQFSRMMIRLAGAS